MVLVIILLVSAKGKGKDGEINDAAAQPQEPASGETVQKSAPKSPAKVTAPVSTPVTKTPPAPEKIILDLSSEFAQEYQSELGEFLDDPANFNKHYVVASWPCGSGCVRKAIIDRNNGKVFLPPLDNYQSKRPGPSFVPYSLDSNRYRIVNDDVIEVYEFESGRFTLVNIEQL